MQQNVGSQMSKAQKSKPSSTELNRTMEKKVKRASEDLGRRRLLHEMEEVSGGLHRLGDLIGHRGFGRSFSAATSGC